MRIKVLLFASLREIVGASEIVLDVPEGTVEDLLAHLVREHPALRSHLPHVRVAVNRAFVGPKTPLRPSDEVALLPPVGGG
ncbi:MAG: molybdopterin converting factor subunit 1 [Candidatus Bipolaricaulaceae bacterium]